MNTEQKINTLLNNLHGLPANAKITHARIREGITDIISWQANEILHHINCIEYERGKTEGVMKHKKNLRSVLNQCETLGYSDILTLDEIRKMV